MLNKNFSILVKIKNEKNNTQSFWLNLPCSKAYLEKEIFVHFGNDYSLVYEDIECNVIDLKCYCNEININKLNYLATLIQDFDGYNVIKIKAIIEEGNFSKTLDDLINTILNIDYFEFVDGISNYDDLFKYYNLNDSISYENQSLDLLYTEYGSFINGGYLSCSNEFIPIKYDGSNVPINYCLI